jgi:hypothetical protein
MLAIATVENEVDALADRIAETAAMLDAATHRLLTDIRRFDELLAWHHQGALSMAHWLHWRCGIALGAAREKVRVAHALVALPDIDDALRRGEVSYSKVRAMTRVATADTEATLLAYARSSTASQLERICRLYRQVTDTSVSCARGDRFVRVRETDDGFVRIEMQLLPDEAARVLAACDVSAGTRADGLVAMAERELRGDAPTRPPVEITLHVDAATLSGHLEDGRGVPAETCRRLLCDAGVVPVLDDVDGNPLDVGRKTRTIPTAIRRALSLRDRGCRYPGCTNRLVDGHHVRPWIEGGPTSLANLVSLCRRHHTFLHEGGCRVRARGDDFDFFLPNGTRIPTAGTARPSVELSAWIPRQGLSLGPQTACPRWDGTPPDYAAAIDALVR